MRTLILATTLITCTSACTQGDVMISNGEYSSSNNDTYQQPTGPVCEFDLDKPNGWGVETFATRPNITPPWPKMEVGAGNKLKWKTSVSAMVCGSVEIQDFSFLLLTGDYPWVDQLEDEFEERFTAKVQQNDVEWTVERLNDSFAITVNAPATGGVATDSNFNDLKFVLDMKDLDPTVGTAITMVMMDIQTWKSDELGIPLTESRFFDAPMTMNTHVY